MMDALAGHCPTGEAADRRQRDPEAVLRPVWRDGAAVRIAGTASV